MSDHDEMWRVMALPFGRIEHAKALAAEQWLDPVSNGWSEPFVQAVERQELRERPIGGTYELEIELAPEVRIDNVEGVQILAETRYWVKQE